MTRAFNSMYQQDAQFTALDEIRESALRTLSRAVADFLEGGAGTESTLRANRAAFERRVIRPRLMSGVSNPSTETTFLGIPLSTPLLTAPFGGDGLFHPEGQLAVARAGETCGIAPIVPAMGTYSYEQVAKAAPQVTKIAQLYPYTQFERVAERVRAAGYSALCVTVDCPTAGFRVRDRINRFDPDLSYFGGNLVGESALGIAEMFGQQVAHGAPTWDWARLTEATRRFRMPWIAKGVLTADTAQRAIDAGAAAVIVSNHGGRQLDPAPASLDALPEVAAAVAGRVPIAFDSGVRTGSDLFLALALGADVVVIGRLAVYGLAAGGEAGVRRTIELLMEELRTLMILAGVPSIDEFDATLVAER
jgi:4-hydroxymandelate oxidase